MRQAQQGDRVRVNFTGKLEDGTIFDTTYDQDDCGCGDDECSVGPVEFVIGADEFFARVEAALVGMAAGERGAVVVPAADAFGAYEQSMVFTIERSQLPAGMDPVVDQELELVDDNDETFVVTVIETAADTITIDANHPLAGQDLTFELELVEIL